MSSNVQGTLPRGVSLAPNWQDLAVDAYREKLSVAAACRAGGISRQTYYNYVKNDPLFAERIQEAKEDAKDNLKESAYVRAKDGTPQVRRTYDPKTGKVTSETETIQHETHLTIRMLEALDPETFTPRSRNELTGPYGGPVQVDLTEIKREKLTIAVQNGLDSGWSLRDTLEYLTIRGVSKEDLALIRGEDLIIQEAKDITPGIMGASGIGGNPDVPTNGNGSEPRN